LGLYHLQREGTVPRWLESPLVARMREYTKNSEQVIGKIAGVSQLAV
jgi:hypothetical protein